MMDGLDLSWMITPYTREMMTERGITPNELSDLVVTPERREPADQGGTHVGRTSAFVWRPGIDPDTGQETRYIETVLLLGPGQSTWEDEERFIPVDREGSVRLIDLIMGQHVHKRAAPKATTDAPPPKAAKAPKATTPKPGARKRPTRTRKTFPVVVTQLPTIKCNECGNTQAVPKNLTAPQVLNEHYMRSHADLMGVRRHSELS